MTTFCFVMPDLRSLPGLDPGASMVGMAESVRFELTDVLRRRRFCGHITLLRNMSVPQR
jgi:hypothetical protein